MTMDITEAIRLADEWRKTDACGTSAKVAVALLNELERVRGVQKPQQDDKYEWRYVVGYGMKQMLKRPQDALAQAQSKANDDMLAAQRNLLLREDGYPNAPVPRKFAGPAHKSAVAIREQWFKQKLGE